MAFPGELVVLDDANRADGTAHAGAGSTIWASTDLGGGSSALVVAGNALATTSPGEGAVTATDAQDLVRVFEWKTGGGFFAYFFRVQSHATSGWTGYWFIIDGSSWKLFKRTTGGGSNTEVSAVTRSSLADGDLIGVRAYGTLIELYHNAGGTWDTTPVITVTDTSITATGRGCLQFGGTGIRVDNVWSGDPALVGPTTGTTIHVDPDHPASSDAFNRTQASDPSTPLVSIQRAVALAVAGPAFHDTILVQPATVANAADTVDPRCYGYTDFGRYSSPSIPYKDNTGNEAIVIQGDRTGSFMRGMPDDPDTATFPRWLGFSSRSLKNWTIQGFQIGYDTGTVDVDDNPLDTLGVTNQQRPEDLRVRDCHFTSGGFNVEYWDGDVEIDSCTVNSPLSKWQGQNGNFYDGRGFGFSSVAGDPLGGNHAGRAWIHDTTFDYVRGNDGIQAGLGAVDNPDAELLVEDCLFHNVTENGPGGNPDFHTDAIQILGGYRFTVRRNVFIGCSNALMASDYQNLYVTFEGNLVTGGGAQVTVQGTNNLVIQQNTMIRSGFPGSNVIIFAARQVPVSTILTFRNNVTTGLDIQAGTDIHASSTIENNIVSSAPGSSTPYGDYLEGVPEFGTSARVEAYPTDTLEGEALTYYELANSPIDSPGIGQGQVIDGVTVDLLGRAFTSPPDCGALQSDPGTVVVAVPRPPYIITRTPQAGQTGVAADVSPSATLYPTPGHEIDPTSVGTSSAYVTDVTGQVIPAVVTLSDPDVNGRQTVTADLKTGLDPAEEGDLYALATYRVNLTGGIEDDQGSALIATSWTFRVVGPAGPAIGVPGSGPVGRTFTLGRDWRFPVGTVMQLRRTTGDGRAKGPVIDEQTVEADGTVTFEGLDTGVFYVAGPSVDGPFTQFRVYV